MNTVDTAIIGILVVSALISVVRGFFREVLSLVAWTSAAWIAVTFTPSFGAFLQTYITVPALRIAAAFVTLFLLTLILASMVNRLVGQLIKRTGFSGTDRAVGMIFGLIRGGVIVAVLVLVAGVTRLPQEPWWQESLLIGHFQQMAVWLRANLPSEIAGSITL